MDFHAEATGEKRALGFYADGRVTALFGTHTHVPTADECLLPHHTGYLTDAGMTGPIDSVLGVKPEIIIGKLKTKMPARFEWAKGPCKMDCVLFTAEERTGLCTGVERVFHHLSFPGCHPSVTQVTVSPHYLTAAAGKYIIESEEPFFLVFVYGKERCFMEKMRTHPSKKKAILLAAGCLVLAAAVAAVWLFNRPQPGKLYSRALRESSITSSLEKSRKYTSSTTRTCGT